MFCRHVDKYKKIQSFSRINPLREDMNLRKMSVLRNMQR